MTIRSGSDWHPVNYNYYAVTFINLLNMHAVISYVGDSDVDISNEIQKNIESRESLDAVFSRNKMFRRRMKRKMKEVEPEG